MCCIWLLLQAGTRIWLFQNPIVSWSSSWSLSKLPWVIAPWQSLDIQTTQLVEPGGTCRCPGCDIAHERNLHLSEEAARHLKDASYPLKCFKSGNLFSVLSWILCSTVCLPARSELPCRWSLADGIHGDDLCAEALCWNEPDTVVLWLLFPFLLF